MNRKSASHTCASWKAYKPSSNSLAVWLVYARSTCNLSYLPSQQNETK